MQGEVATKKAHGLHPVGLASGASRSDDARAEVVGLLGGLRRLGGGGGGAGGVRVAAALAVRAVGAVAAGRGRGRGSALADERDVGGGAVVVAVVVVVGADVARLLGALLLH